MKRLQSACAGALAATLISLFGLSGCADGNRANRDGGQDASFDGGNDAGSDGGLDAGATCESEPWTTYAHDARRSSASGGCVQGPLTTNWRYVPTAPEGRSISTVFRAVADRDAAYLQWRATYPPYRGTTAADKVSSAGVLLWTYDTGTDTNLGNWPTLGLGSLVLNDDGIYFIDPSTGGGSYSSGVDDWGQTAADSERLYAVNTWHVDGPGVYVGAMDGSGASLWRQNEQQDLSTRLDLQDTYGGMAADEGALFYAPRYSRVEFPFASGLYAFDSASGAVLWQLPATPASAISAGSGLVFAVEQIGAEYVLVAHRQTDGLAQWSASLGNFPPGVQAPILVGGLAIVATGSSIQAFNAGDGSSAWSASIAGASSTLSFPGGAIGTNMAAAAGSRTLVVTSFSAIYVLDVTTGAEQWMGQIPEALGRPHDPVIVGHTVYVVDSGQFPNPPGLISLQSAGPFTQ